MTDKWTRVRDSFGRAHDDLFSSSKFQATLYNHLGASYDPDQGRMTGGKRTEVGTIQVEYIPPTIDTNVDVDGSSFSWDASIRFPYQKGDLTIADGESKTISSGTTAEFNSVTIKTGGTLTVEGSLIVYGTLDTDGTLDNNGTVVTLGTSTFPQALVPLGEDAKEPTEVELADPAEANATVYQLHGYSIEQGSGMIHCRLVEE